MLELTGLKLQYAFLAGHFKVQVVTFSLDGIQLHHNKLHANLLTLLQDKGARE